MRQIIKEIEVNTAYRWFLEYDSVMFDGLYKKVISKFTESEIVGIDSGYKTPWIMKQIIDCGRLPATPYKRPMTKQGLFKKYDYVYDEYSD